MTQQTAPARSGEMSLDRLTQTLVREMAAWRDQSVAEARRDEQQKAKQDREAIVASLLLLHELKTTLTKQQNDPAAIGLAAQDLIRRSLLRYAEAGYTLEDFTGQPLNDDLRERLEIIGYRHHDAEEDSVSETVVPQISKDGTILRHGVVFGASRDADGNSEPSINSAQEQQRSGS